MLEILTGVIVELTVQAITKSAGPVANAAGILKPPKPPRWLADSLTPTTSSMVVSMLSELTGAAVSKSAIGKTATCLRSIEAMQFQRSITINALTQEPGWQGSALKPLTALLIYVGRCDRNDAEIIAPILVKVLINAAADGIERFQAESGQYYGILRQLAWQEKTAGYVESILGEKRAWQRHLSADELEEVSTFAIGYAEELAARTADLVPQHFDIQTRIPIDQLYVAPRFVARGDEVQRVAPMADNVNTHREEVYFPLTHAMRRMYRTVILGAPGAGKTTFTQKLIHDLCGRPGMKDVCLPFLVTLRKYETRRADDALSFVKYLSDLLSGEYQITTSERIIDYIFRTGRALVIFDGLDELQRIDHRKDVVEAVQSFARQYPEISIVATSRVTGYDKASLDDKIFSHIYLDHLDDESVVKYVHNWFGLTPRLDASARSAVAKAFLRDSETVRDLRCNPLLLSLMCNIYRGKGYIPQNRADLYERCAVMLFNDWDQSRGIETGGPLREDARYALGDVAYWALTDPMLASGIPEGPLKSRLTEFLKVERYGTQAAAEDAAEHLLRLWQGRAWILTDMGSDTLRPIYQFTHRTFLEYFAAKYIARNNGTAEDLWSALREKIVSGEWEMVAQISLQAYKDSTVRGVDQVCAIVITEIEEQILGAVEALRFICKYIDALGPSPAMISRLVATSTLLALPAVPCCKRQPKWIDYELSRDRQIPVARLSDQDAQQYRADPVNSVAHRGAIEYNARQVSEPLALLFTGSAVTVSLARDQLRAFCGKLVEGDDRSLAARALLVLLSEQQFIAAARLVMAELEILPRSGPMHVDETWTDCSSWVRRWIGELWEENFWIPVVAARIGLRSVDDVFPVIGLDGLFNSEPAFDVVTLEKQKSLAEEVICRYTEGNASAHEIELLRLVGNVVYANFRDHRHAPSIDPMWFNGSQVSETVIRGTFLDSPGGAESPGFRVQVPASVQPERDPDALLGAAFMLAVFFEAEKWKLHDLSERGLASLSLGPAQKMEDLFLWRFTGEGTVGLDQAPLDGTRLELMSLWARRRLSFVA